MSSEERREARKKRILQNSENRLKKITGELISPPQAETKPLDPVEYLTEERGTIPNNEDNSVTTSQHHGILDKKITPDIPDNTFESFSPQDLEAEDKRLEGIVVTQTPEMKTKVRKHVKFDDLLTFSLLALIVCTLDFYDFNIFGENLLSLFSLVEVTRFFWSSAFKMDELMNLGMLESAISLSGVNNTKAMHLLRSSIYIFRVVKSVWVDLCYYLVTYFIIAAIFQGF